MDLYSKGRNLFSVLVEWEIYNDCSQVYFVCVLVVIVVVTFYLRKDNHGN